MRRGTDFTWKRPDLRTILGMTFPSGAFGPNFPIFTSAVSVKIFHGGADPHGFPTSAMAVGTLVGVAVERLSLALTKIPYYDKINKRSWDNETREAEPAKRLLKYIVARTWSSCRIWLYCAV